MHTAESPALFTAVLLFTACSSPPAPTPHVPRLHPVYPSVAYDPAQVPVAETDRDPAGGFDFQTRGPCEFLAFLRQRHATAQAAGARIMSYTVWGTHRGWIKASDLPALEAALTSSEPCLAVVKETCSFLPTEPSTVGREAAFLIEGYRAELDRTGYGGYPPRLTSAR